MGIVWQFCKKKKNSNGRGSATENARVRIEQMPVMLYSIRLNG